MYDSFFAKFQISPDILESLPIPKKNYILSVYSDLDHVVMSYPERLFVRDYARNWFALGPWQCNTLKEINRGSVMAKKSQRGVEYL